MMAVESADASKITIPTFDAPDAALPTPSQSNAQNSRAPGKSSADQGYINRSQIDIPAFINLFTSEACALTVELARWLVQEARVFADNEGMYIRDGDTIRLVNTSKFIALAQMIRDYKHCVGGLAMAVNELKYNLHYRRQVTKFFTSFRCKEGHALKSENECHVYFNEEILQKVLDLLESAQKTETS